MSVDQAQLEVVLSASVDRALAGMASFERSLKTAETGHIAAGQQAEIHGRKVEDFIGKMTRLANVGELFVAWETISRGVQMLTGEVGNIEKFNLDLLRTTEILGGNATAASTWSVAAGELNIDVGLVDKAFSKLSTDLNSTGNPALKQMGIAAEDARGRLRPLNDVINDAADYFQRHAGASNNAALANALFGKSGYELIPILEQGRSGLAQLTEEARKYGLILDATAIERNAAFTFQLKEAEMAAHGLEISVGNALLPGLAALGQAFSKVVSDNLPAFIAGMNRAVSYVIGFVEAITGMTMSVDQGATTLANMSSITGDTGSAMDSTAGAAQGLADAQQRIRDAAKDATSAIDDQVRALNAQMAASQFADRQEKLAEQVAAKGQDIQKLQRDQYTQYWLGNFVTAQNVGEQITKAHAEQADLQKQITTNSSDDQTKAQVAALEAQKRSIQSAADDQIQAMQKAAKGTTDALSAGFAGIPSLASKAGALSGQGFAQDFNAESIGRKMGSDLMDALFGPQTTKLIQDGGGHWHREFTRVGGGDWLTIGKAVGDAIGTGISTAIGVKLSNYFGDVAKKSVGLQTVDSQHLFQEIRHLFGYAKGGMVPGPLGAPQLAIVHGGEEVRTPAQQAAADMGETNGLLRQLIALVGSAPSGSSSGTDALLNELMSRARGQGARGMIGAFGR